MMHSAHGNTLIIKQLNINGMQTTGRVPLVLSQEFDILILTETHATSEVQKIFRTC